MRFGKVAMAMLMAGSATIVALHHYRATTGHSPVEALGGLLVVAFFSLAGLCGTVGVVHDRRRWLAALVASIAGGFLLLMWRWKGFG